MSRGETPDAGARRGVTAAHRHIVDGHEEHDRGDPRDGIGRTDARKAPQLCKDEGRKHPARQLRDARERRDGALADALQRVAVDVDGAEEGIERALPDEILPSVGDDLRIVRGDVGAEVGVEEEFHQRFAQADGERKPEDGAREHIDHARRNALPDARVLLRAVVLPRERRHGGAERGKRLVGDVVDLGRRGVRRHDARHGAVQPVERRLLDDAADRRDGKLQRHREPDREMPRREAAVPAEMRSLGAQDGIAPQRKGKARPARDELREDGRERRAAVVHMKAEDEPEVQPDVEDRRQDEKDERRARIAHGAQEPRDDVVKDGRADAAEDDQKIGIGIVVVLRGRLHDGEQRPRERHGDGGHDDRRKDAKKIAHARGAAHAFLVPRAERLRDLDGKARRQPVDEAEDEEGDGTREPDARKGVRPHRIADDDGVRHVVQLLEHAPDKDGQREQKNEFVGVSLGKVLHDRLRRPCRRSAAEKDGALFRRIIIEVRAKKASDFAPDFRIAANFFRPCKGS